VTESAAPRRRKARDRGAWEYTPTAEHRAVVKALVANGLTHRQIANYLGIARNTMLKNFRAELDTGFDTVYAAISGNLVKQALGGDLRAQIFWLKTKAGWRETTRLEGPSGGPIPVAAMMIATDDPVEASRIYQQIMGK